MQENQMTTQVWTTYYNNSAGARTAYYSVDQNITSAGGNQPVYLVFPKTIFVAIFVLLIFITVVGNTLVVMAVLTSKRLRTVTNCFVLNLAITDWLVGTCVMPPSVILYVLGSWKFGWILCDIWISLDVLLCTGSILSLCAISLDRYLAVTQPLTYSKKRRSKRLALLMILIVWITALSITCPPYLGWYEPGRRREDNAICRYNQNKGYVVFSAMGSFFIPLSVMLYVYLKIGYVLKSRRKRIVRDANSERAPDHETDFPSESDHFHSKAKKLHVSNKQERTCKCTYNYCNSIGSSIKCKKKLSCSKGHSQKHLCQYCNDNSYYELMEISHLSSLVQCSTLGCKFTNCNGNQTLPANNIRMHNDRSMALNYSESRSPFADTCLTASRNSKNLKLNYGETTFGEQLHSHDDNLPQGISSCVMPLRISTSKYKNTTKTTKTLSVVMGGFIACWLPFFTYYLLIPFLPKAAVLEGLMSFFTWVGWVNCAINPFIYAFYNPDFRTAFWRLLTLGYVKQKSPGLVT